MTLKITPDRIVEKYWMYPWTFKRDGSLEIHIPGRPALVFKEKDYVPKNFREGKP
jgi:hypothetical protein